MRAGTTTAAPAGKPWRTYEVTRGGYKVHIDPAARPKRAYTLSPEGLATLRAAAGGNRPWERSTGPRTREGKRQSRMNALKGGHFSRKAKAVRANLYRLIRGLPTPDTAEIMMAGIQMGLNDEELGLLLRLLKATALHWALDSYPLGWLPLSMFAYMKGFKMPRGRCGGRYAGGTADW